MTTETGTSLLIGAASAVGVAASWGMMRVTVQVVERDVKGMRDDIRDIYNLSREISDRVSKMEGRMDK